MDSLTRHLLTEQWGYEPRDSAPMGFAILRPGEQCRESPVTPVRGDQWPASIDCLRRSSSSTVEG